MQVQVLMVDHQRALRGNQHADGSTWLVITLMVEGSLADADGAKRNLVMHENGCPETHDKNVDAAIENVNPSEHLTARQRDLTFWMARSACLAWQPVPVLCMLTPRERRKSSQDMK